MSILKIARIGHPVVRGTARELTRQELRGRDIQRLIDDMVETMHEYDGVGVAAPQVHAPLRLAVIEVPASDMGTEDGVPLTVLANPVVTPLAPEIALGFEGCLSVPGLRGVVPRLERVRLEALDRDARPYVIEAQGFFARVIQHECDHLDGRVYLDRMRDLRSLAFIEEFEKHVLHAGDEEPGGADGGG
jgi:peptide deformylase